MVTIPRTLRITRDHRVMIKNLEIGSLSKSKSGWEFTGTHEAVPSSLVCPTARLIKEELTKRIDRDTYLQIVESQPDE